MRSFYSTIRPVLAGLALFEAGAGLHAQVGPGSPYSSFAFGDLLRGTQVSPMLMGDAGVAVVDPAGVLQVNPASYTGLRTTVFETGARMRYASLRNDVQDTYSRNTRWLGFSLGVPFGNGRCGWAMGLQPVTEVSYRLIDREVLPDGGGDVEYLYRGEGGLNRAYMGLGWAVYQQKDSLKLGNGSRLSIGANFNYLFGHVDRFRETIYPRGSGYNNHRYLSTLSLSDPVFNFGVHYQTDLVKRREKGDEGLKLVVGATAELPATLNVSRSDLAYSFVVGANGVETIRDTLIDQRKVPGTLGLPMQVGLGATIYNVRWTWTFEMRTRDWSGTALNVEGYRFPEKLGRSSSYALGASWRPMGAREGGNFLQRSIWRAGFRWTEDYLVVKEKQLTDFGMAFGTSLPLLGSLTRSRLNFGAVFGRRGSAGTGTIQENYVDILIGLTFTPSKFEPWLQKRRIN